MIEAKKCASSSTTLETLTGHQRLPRLIKDGMSVFDIMRLVGRYRICR